VKRSAPIVTASFILLAASILLLFMPLSTCPDCRGVTAPDSEPRRFAPIGCPRCEDSGRIPTANRWLRRGLDPGLVSLIESSRSPLLDEQQNFKPTLLRLGERSGLKLDLGPFLFGETVFVDDGRDVLLAAMMKGSITGDYAWDHALLLWFDVDGRILDVLDASSPGGKSGVSLLWSPGPREARVLTMAGEDSKPRTFVLRRGPEATTLTAAALRLRARNGRFEVVP
jgi:hypothetical protein